MTTDIVTIIKVLMEMTNSSEPVLGLWPERFSVARLPQTEPELKALF
jgi:hypothetical protein